jgi:plasmid stability protein
MRQLLARLPDDLHERLKARAAGEGRSLNSLVVEALADLVGDEPDRRTRVRARARALGVLVELAAPPDAPAREDAIATTRGAGAAGSEGLDWSRGVR